MKYTPEELSDFEIKNLVNKNRYKKENKQCPCCVNPKF